MTDTTKEADQRLELEAATSIEERRRNGTGTKQYTVDYNDLLTSAGEFGPYQILLFFSTFPFYAFGAFVYFGQIFMTQVSPNHWCSVPELMNLTEIERRNLAIPKDDTSVHGYSKCKMYAANWTEVLLTGVTTASNWSIVPCQQGWEFNKTEIPYPTITSDLGWLCDKGSYQADAQAINFAGSIVGGVIIGWMADRFGRLPALVASNMLGCVGGIVSTFSRNFSEFAASRFIAGMASDNCMMLAYLLVLEYTVPHYRTLMANLAFSIFSCTFATALPWIALACGHWKIFSLVTSVPLALALLSPFIIPESPGWLLSKGRVDSAINKILFISRINKKKIPHKQIEQFKSSVEQSEAEKSSSFLKIFSKVGLRKIYIIICVEFMCCSVVFDALIRSLGQLNFDFFISFTLLSLTEFPSMLLVALIMDWTGRRWMLIITMSVLCICSILTVCTSGSITVVLVVIAKFCSNMSYSASIQWTAEILPTAVRGSGVAITHILGYLATILSPYIVYLNTYVTWLPLVATGCIAAFGALIAFGVPETARKDMPHTFEDAEALAQDNRVWIMPRSRTKDRKGQVNNSFELGD